jgi:hypothetical protein
MTTSDNMTVPVADELERSLTSQKHPSDAENVDSRMVKDRTRAELMILELIEVYSIPPSFLLINVRLSLQKTISK